MYEIYTTQYCGWCQRAKALLRQHGSEYREVDVTDDVTLQQDIAARTGRKTVPQIFREGHYIGGYDDLVKYLAGQTAGVE